MKQVLNSIFSSDCEKEELEGFSRSIAELHWLLLILVLLYYFIPINPVTNTDALITIMVGYAAFILAFRYVRISPKESSWKLAIETWVMISFITSVLWYTGMVESPLLNLYLLVIIACAITLGKAMTLLEVGLIACCYLFVAHASYSEAIFVPATFTSLMARFSPFLLVAYVTSMLASDIIRAKRKITALSQTDDLTGLLNMRAFSMVLEKETARAGRYGHPFSVMMIDIDKFKNINDRYGHTTGSLLLKAIARSINECVRTTDIVARYGGDEFVILMAHTGREHAVTAGERICAAIHHKSIEINGQHISTSASIGIAAFPEDVARFEEVLDKADMALYRSKQTGRNRVSHYRGDLETTYKPGLVTAAA
ncbi:MAG: GGDEF domain-containing protein [Gammaproteobacteria bacterium]